MIRKKKIKLAILVGVSCLLSMVTPVCVNAVNNAIPFDKYNIETWHQSRFNESSSFLLCNHSGANSIGAGACGYFAVTSILVKCGYLNPKTENPIDVIKYCKSKGLCDGGEGCWGHFNSAKIGELNPDLEYVSHFDLLSYPIEDSLAFLKKKYYEGYFLQVCIMVEGGTDGHYIFIDGYTSDGDIIITDSAYDGMKWSDFYGKHNTKVKYVRIYKSKSGKKCNELKSVYDIDAGNKKLFATGTSIDTSGDGSVSGDGRSQSPEMFLDILKKYSDNVGKFKKEGIYTVYSNRGISTVYDVAVKKAKEGVVGEVKGVKKNDVHRIKVNCALLPTWGLNELGILDDGQAIWGTKSQSVHYSKGAKTNIEKYCEVIDYGEGSGYPTPNELIKKGELQPGDIIAWANHGHTNVYIGDDKWYDAGRGGPCKPTYMYTDIRQSDMLGGLSCIFSDFGPCKTVNMNSDTIAVIIRVKTIEGLTDEEMYRYNRLISEWDLVGMPESFAISEDQISLTFTSELNTDEEKVVEELRSNIQESKLNILEISRVVCVMTGIILMFYGVLFFVAYLFDLSNNFIDISLLALISLGKYRASSEREYGSSEKKGKVTYMTTKMVVKRVIILEAVGLLLVSGTAFSAIRYIMYKIGIGV